MAFFSRVLMLAHYIFTLVRIKHIYQKPQISTYTNTVCFFPRSLKTQGALKSNYPLLSEYPFFLNLASTALYNIVSSSSSHSKYYSFAHLLQHRTLPLYTPGEEVSWGVRHLLTLQDCVKWSGQRCLLSLQDISIPPQVCHLDQVPFYSSSSSYLPFFLILYNPRSFV